MKPTRTTSMFLLIGAFTLNSLTYASDENLDINIRESGAYLSNTYGNGHNSVGGDMQNRALEVRFGKEIGSTSSKGARVRIDFIHYNEGHPTNNHRDGFAGQIVLRTPMDKNLKAEFGVGPYFSMNTTTIDGIEYDDQQVGVLATAAVLYYFTNNGWHIRGQYNHVNIPGKSRSDAVLVGVGKDFGVNEYKASEDITGSKSIWLDIAAGNSITNHGGTHPDHNAQIEFKTYYGGGFAWSVAAIHEGDDKVRTDRNGVAAQVWYVQPINEKWSMSGGVGPYFAINKRGSNNVLVNALISVRAERTIGSKGIKVFVDFSRVVSRDNNDRDLIRVGVQKRLK